MKKKKGFISVSVVYSFFIVFLLVMLAMLADYVNKRHLLDKTQTPQDGVCTKDDTLSVCIQKLEDKYGKVYPGDIDNTQCVTEPGLYKSKDDYGDTLFFSGAVENNYVAFGGYMWRIVRINGDGSIRLIYAGEPVKDKDGNIQKDEDGNIIYSKPYIKLDTTDVPGMANIEKTRYNTSVFTEGDCTLEIKRSFESRQTVESCFAAGWEKPYAKVKCLYQVINNINADIEIVRGKLQQAEDDYAYNCLDNNNNNVDCTTNILADFDLKTGVNSCDNADKVIGKNRPYRKVKCLNKVIENLNEELYTYKTTLGVPTSGAEKALENAVNNYNCSCLGVGKKSNGEQCQAGGEGDKAAYMPNRIGYMINKSANLAKYDSKYDNQDSSEVKLHVDKWYKDYLNKNNTLDSYLSFSTIFCGDKNLENYYPGSSVYEFSANIRIPNNGADFKCRDTGSSANYTGNYNFVANRRYIESYSNSIINLSRYTVGNQNKVYYFHSKATIQRSKDTPHKLIQIQGYYTKMKNRSGDSTDSLNSNSFLYVKNGDTFDKISLGNGEYTRTTKNINLNEELLKLRNNMSASSLGNGALTYPIALLSADEAVKAGLIYHAQSTSKDYIKNNDPNSECNKSYLLDGMPDGTGFWTMTLARTDTVAGSHEYNRFGASYFVVTKNLKIKSINNNGSEIDMVSTGLSILKERTNKKDASANGYYMRPVINIKDVDNKVKQNYTINYGYTEGNEPGTKNNPIIIGE